MAADLITNRFTGLTQRGYIMSGFEKRTATTGLRSSISGIIAVYGIRKEQLCGETRETVEALGVHDDVRRLADTLMQLSRYALSLPLSPRGGGIGRDPRPRFPEEFHACCGEWLMELGFFPRDLGYPMLSYYNARHHSFMEVQWDPYDCEMFVFLGRKRRIRDIVPMVRATPLWCFEKPMKDITGRQFRRNTGENLENLRSVITEIMKIYAVVMPRAEHFFDRSLAMCSERSAGS